MGMNYSENFYGVQDVAPAILNGIPLEHDEPSDSKIIDYGVGEGCQSATGVAVCKTVCIIHPSTRTSLTTVNICTQITPFTSCKSFGTMVTTEPLPSVANTRPPGFSRMNAPPPSEARIIARM